MSHITITPSEKNIEVRFAGETIAISSNVLELKEGSYPVVFYLPLNDVRKEAIKPTSHTTTCPWKGQANYWTLTANGESAENAMWGYLNPKEDVPAIKNHVSFYTNKVDMLVDGEKI